jgi:hypothetical protein
MLRLQKDVGGLVRATFSKSITNQAGPLLELHYGRWTRLSNVIAAHISTVLEKRGTITRGRRSHRDRRQASELGCRDEMPRSPRSQAPPLWCRACGAEILRHAETLIAMSCTHSPLLEAALVWRSTGVEL